MKKMVLSFLTKNRKKIMKKYLILLIIPLLFFIKSINAETNVPERPSNGIYDPSHYLSEKAQNKLSEFNSNSDTQIGVYIVDTLDGESIEETSNKIAREWKIGHTDTNKGALIAIAVNDRKFRIETSNELSTILTDAKSKSILGSSKSFMKNKDYDGAIIHIIDEIQKITSSESISNPTDDSEKTKYNLTSISNTFQEKLSKALTIIATIIGLPLMIKIVYETVKYLKLSKRSRFDYNGPNKLTPKDHNFKENKTWTTKRTQRFWQEDYKKRSQYDYIGSDKLYPSMLFFEMNSSWTKDRIRTYEEKLEREKRQREEYEEQLKEDRLRRSNYNYKGKDKLYPNDYNFIDNSTWTALLVSEYLSSQRSHNESSNYSSSYSDNSSSSYDSSSSWSSTDWGGGGFDGGGASDGW